MGIIPIHCHDDINARLVREGIEARDETDIFSNKEFSIYNPNGEKHLIKAKKEKSNLI